MQLIISSKVIPWAPGVSLPLVRRSPLFATSESKIPGSYIFNTSLPGTEVLRSVFGQAHRVQRGGRATAELPFTISDGSMRLTGTVTLVQADRVTYEAAFAIDNGDLAGKLKLKTLKDLDLGGDQVIGIYSCGYTDPNWVVFTYQAVPADPFINYSNFKFNVRVDLTNSIDYPTGTFTASETNDYRFTAKLRVVECNPVTRLDMLINGVVFQSWNMVGDTTLNLLIDPLPLTIGDVVEFKIYSESIFGTPQNMPSATNFIYYKIEAGSFLDFSTPCSFSLSALADQDTFDYVTFPIHNKDLLSNFPEDAFLLDNLSIKTIYNIYFPILNYYVDGAFPLFLLGEKEGEVITSANLFTPFVYMNTLIKKIASEAGYSLINNPFDSVDFKNLVLFNAYAENTYNSSLTTILPTKTTFNLTDHVPEMLQSDFLNYVTWLTGYVPAVDNNVRTITFIDIKDKHIVTPTNKSVPFPGKILRSPLVKIDPEFKGIKFELKTPSTDKYISASIKELSDKLIYKGSVTHLNQLPANGNQVNDMYLVTESNEYYVYQYNPDIYALTWWFYSKKFPLNYTEGSEPFLQISTELCPILNSYMLDENLGAPNARIWHIPRTEQAGILEGFPESLSAEYGLQVLRYAGMAKDSLNNDYPLGSSVGLDAKSLFDNRYKRWLQWIAYSAKPVTLKAILTAGELQRIKDDQIYSGNGFNFLVKEIRVNLQVDGLSEAEVDVYTV